MHPIKRERARQRLSLRELGRRSGVPPGTLSGIERGTREPQILTLAKIADALGRDVEEISEEPVPKVTAPHSPTPETQEDAEERRNYRAEVEDFIAGAEEMLEDPDLMQDTCRGMLHTGGILYTMVQAARTKADFSVHAPSTNTGGYTWREYNDLVVADQSMRRFLKKAGLVYRNKFGNPDQETENMLKALPGGLDEEAG